MQPASERTVTEEEKNAAQRLADAVNLHVVALSMEGTGRDRPAYIAVRLHDGRPADPANPLYDSRADATRHHKFTLGVFFVKVGRETMPLNEALIVLQMNRMAFKRGVVFTEEEVVAPQLTELMNPFIPRTLRGLQ
jgi:hypothetical protein